MGFYVTEEQAELIKEAIKKSEYKTQKRFAEEVLFIKERGWGHKLRGVRKFSLLELYTMGDALCRFIEIDVDDEELIISKVDYR